MHTTLIVDTMKLVQEDYNKRSTELCFHHHHNEDVEEQLVLNIFIVIEN
jgi:hypothetical protein